jgi:hypothetical protein
MYLWLLEELWRYALEDLTFEPIREPEAPDSKAPPPNTRIAT